MTESGWVMGFFTSFGILMFVLFLLALPWMMIALIPFFFVVIGVLALWSGMNSSAKKPIRVLLVDDDPSSLQVIENYLQNMHFNYEVIDNPQKAAMQLLNGEYDLVILDNDMQELSGSQILTQADRLIELDSQRKRSMHSRVVPVIGYTGAANSKWNLLPLIHFKFLNSISKQTSPLMMIREIDRSLSYGK